MRFIFGCGGTGGHIYPALALAKELCSQGHTASFIGQRDGMEAALVSREGYLFHPIRIQKLSRKLHPSLLAFPFLLMGGIINCWHYLGKQRPDGVVCTGGFVSGPVAIAAILHKIPLFFHESNSFPGLTTRFLAKYTHITFVSWPFTLRHLKNAPLQLTGIPLFKREMPENKLALAELGMNPDQPIILISGGSQGSLMINRSIDEALDAMLEKGWQVIWQTGQSGYEEFSRRHKDKPGLHIFAFSPYLPLFYKYASMAITRAGAMTIAELEESKLPAILIPLPHAAENHQYFNAIEQQQKGLAFCLEQHNLDTANLMYLIEDMLNDTERYRANYQSITPNTAAQDISRMIIEDLEKEKHHAG